MSKCGRLLRWLGRFKYLLYGTLMSGGKPNSVRCRLRLNLKVRRLLVCIALRVLLISVRTGKANRMVALGGHTLALALPLTLALCVVIAFEWLKLFTTICLHVLFVLLQLILVAPNHVKNAHLLTFQMSLMTILMTVSTFSG